MKKENITISMEQEKLRATKRYMAKKEVDIERELSDALEKLYEKYVPAQVREYIDESADDTQDKKPKAKPSISRQAEVTSTM